MDEVGKVGSDAQKHESGLDCKSSGIPCECSVPRDASVLFKSGYSCAQSVFAAHAERFGIDFPTALKISAPLGAGVGRMREVCGAFLASAMLLGLARASTSNDASEKAKIYASTQKLAEIFRKENGALLCRDLLKECKDGAGDKKSPVPQKRDAAYFEQRPCPLIVARASAMVDRLLGA